MCDIGKLFKEGRSSGQERAFPLSHMGERGFSLTELLVVMVMFSIIMAGAMSAYISQVKHTGREYKLAESEIELGIAKNIITRDLEMGGYGLAEDYSDAVATPALSGQILGYEGTDGGAGNSDTLKLRGTAIGQMNRASQGWSYVSVAGNGVGVLTKFQFWSDAREDLRVGDAVVLIQPASRQLLVQGTGDRNWLFEFNATSATDADLTLLGAGPIGSGTAFTPPVGTLVYGLETAVSDLTQRATLPFSAVRYYLGATTERAGGCVSGTASLLRAESNTADTATTPNGGTPLLNCVRSFQVVFGLDRDENGTTEYWDDGGVDYANSYTSALQRKRLKQVRAFFLMQASDRDAGYTYPSATIHVGDTLAGEDITLTEEQRKYRWRLVTISVTPRNTR